ncbi:acyl carrier protein [Streptomyces sp. NPDC016172]|uniref:acyl carrier protein n=1 Tax=Streptomyces sp. NPDC016172 TaxID=3364964 RepID=UPI003701C701
MAHAQHSLETVRTWLITWFAGQVRLPAEDIDPGRPFSDYGLNSVGSASLASDIEDHCGVVVTADEMWDHPSVDALGLLIARKLADMSADALGGAS